MILPTEMGGLKLLDPELEIKALLAKLFIRGLIPGASPWKVLIWYKVNHLNLKRGGKWPRHIYFILFATRVRGNGSDVWHGA
jgi:hypothetical protein